MVQAHLYQDKHSITNQIIFNFVITSLWDAILCSFFILGMRPSFLDLVVVNT